MQLKAGLLLLLILIGLSGCTPSKTTPSLPPISSVPMSRPAAAIQNTEAIDQAVKSPPEYEY